MKRHSKAPRTGSRRLALAVLGSVGMLWLCASGVAVAQEGAPASSVDEQERVTAVDVVLELDAVARRGEGRVRALPSDLGLEDFEVRIDGDSRPVVGFFDPRADGQAGEKRDEPWRVVLYFDLELAERDTVRWAAEALSEFAPRLVELGEVELIVAGDGEVRGLAPTRDAELLDGALADLALRPRGAHRQVEFRAEVLEATRDAPESLQDPEVARALVEQEAALVEERLDELLLRLVDRDVSGVKRVLFWVADGFDLAPEQFYALEGVDGERMPAHLREKTAKFSVTLASYGWVAISLSPPPADAGLVPGFRIGKWLFAPGMPTGLIGGTLTREARRDPEAARAHYQIGQSHLSAGEPEEAERSFERALYHFAGDPRTRKDQAVAKAGLGRALEAQGAAAEARQAFAHAVELDPELADELPQARPRLLAPLEFQEALADSTAGRLVETGDGLAEAVASLSRRARLTYQISGVPRGDVRRLEVSLAGSELELRYPSWTRSGIPSGVSAARARRLAEGDFDDGDLVVRARVSVDASGSRAVVVEVDLDSLGVAEDGEAAVTLRITTATGAPGTVQDVRYQRFEALLGEGASTWSYRLPIAPAIDEGWTSVLVEDLDTGRWGADLAD